MSFIGHGLLDFLFPLYCPVCGEPADPNRPICSCCLRLLPYTEHAVRRGNQTELLFVKERRFVRGASYLFYEHDNAARRIIHTAKFHRQPRLAYYLAKQAAADFLQSDFFEGIDLIVPVPLHPRRLRERGYNQSEYIARAISEVTGIPWDSLHHLTRSRDTGQQAMLSQDRRQANVRDAFALNHPEELYRKHILLVDDIVTTGATLTACIHALTPARSCKISVFTLAKAI